MEVLVKSGMRDDKYGTFRNSDEGRRVARSSNWVEGWYENIAPHPIYIRDKYELKRVCQEWSAKTGRVIIPRAFAKRASQGSGLEWNF
jgi:hypothetical protein